MNKKPTPEMDVHVFVISFKEITSWDRLNAGERYFGPRFCKAQFIGDSPLLVVHQRWSTLHAGATSFRIPMITSSCPRPRNVSGRIILSPCDWRVNMTHVSSNPAWPETWPWSLASALSLLLPWPSRSASSRVSIGAAKSKERDNALCGVWLHGRVVSRYDWSSGTLVWPHPCRSHFVTDTCPSLSCIDVSHNASLHACGCVGHVGLSGREWPSPRLTAAPTNVLEHGRAHSCDLPLKLNNFVDLRRTRSSGNHSLLVEDPSAPNRYRSRRRRDTGGRHRQRHLTLPR